VHLDEGRSERCRGRDEIAADYYPKKQLLKGIENLGSLEELEISIPSAHLLFLLLFPPRSTFNTPSNMRFFTSAALTLCAATAAVAQSGKSTSLCFPSSQCFSASALPVRPRSTSDLDKHRGIG